MDALFDQFPNAIVKGLAGGQLGAVDEGYPEDAVKQRLNFLYPVGIYDYGTVDSKKTRWVESSFKITELFACDMRMPAN